MTKQEAIEKHRALWEWLTKENKKRYENNEYLAKKLDYFRKHKISHADRPHHLCYACQYAIEQADELHKCAYCPLDWPDGGCLSYDRNGLYHQYVLAIENDDSISAINIAHKIANLPEKK